MSTRRQEQQILTTDKGELVLAVVGDEDIRAVIAVEVPCYDVASEDVYGGATWKKGGRPVAEPTLAIIQVDAYLTGCPFLCIDPAITTSHKIKVSIGVDVDKCARMYPIIWRRGLGELEYCLGPIRFQRFYSCLMCCYHKLTRHSVA